MRGSRGRPYNSSDDAKGSWPSRFVRCVMIAVATVIILWGPTSIFLVFIGKPDEARWVLEAALSGVNLILDGLGILWEMLIMSF